MKGQNNSLKTSCKIHSMDSIEGVCPLCLNERLIVLASLQRLKPPSPSYQTIQEPENRNQNSFKRKNIRLFSFLDSFVMRHHKSHYQTTSIISPEDSFISINFENNGATSWEKEKETYHLEHIKSSWDHQYQNVTKKKENIYQPMPRPLLMWRKRIGRLLRVISFRKQSSAKVE
ncbi:unnamed protein product, partial [Cochlearia groenlandica]